MNKEMTSIKDFDVYEEKLITECTSQQLQNAISTKWVKRAKRRRRQMPCVHSRIRPRSRSRPHLRLHSFTYHLEIAVDFGSCTWLAHTCRRRQHGVSPRTSHGRSFCDSSRWVLSQWWSSLAGNFAKPCMDLNSPHACGSSTLQVLPHHLGLNA